MYFLNQQYYEVGITITFILQVKKRMLRMVK